MKAPFAVLALLLCATAIHAQPVPAGSGAVSFKEKFKISGGCGSIRGEGTLPLTVNPDGTWLAQASGGDFSGTLTPTDSKGRAWNLSFDATSLDLYSVYLQSAASALCGTSATIEGGAIDKFLLKFSKDQTRVSLQLKSSAQGSTEFGSGRGKHQIKGKGAFGPSP